MILSLPFGSITFTLSAVVSFLPVSTIIIVKMFAL